MSRSSKPTSSNDAEFVDRVRRCLTRRKGLAEKRMFGGTGFLLRGNMCCGVHKGRLILRVGIDAAETALREPHVRPFDITGKPMRGWVMLPAVAIAGDVELKRWIALAANFAGELPPKE